jgi:hypothetical protein
LIRTSWVKRGIARVDGLSWSLKEDGLIEVCLLLLHATILLVVQLKFLCDSIDDDWVLGSIFISSSISFSLEFLDSLLSIYCTEGKCLLALLRKLGPPATEKIYDEIWLQ